MASDLIKHVTDTTFEADVLQADKPVLVDYWAEWCGPCKMIAPLLDDVAKDYAGKLKVAKLNIDENQATPPKFGPPCWPGKMTRNSFALYGVYGPRLWMPPIWATRSRQNFSCSGSPVPGCLESGRCSERSSGMRR